MNRLWSILVRIVVISLLICALTLIPALACTGPAGPAGQPGPQGPAGPAGPQGEVVGIAGASLMASPTSVAIQGGAVRISTIMFTTAGFQPGELVIISMVLDAEAGVEQVLLGGSVNNAGAFTRIGPGRLSFTADPGVYTLKAIGKKSGTVATCGFTIEPEAE